MGFVLCFEVGSYKKLGVAEMPEIAQETKTPKACEILMTKFIKLKEEFNTLSHKSKPILSGKIPDLKEIYRHLQEDK